VGCADFKGVSLAVCGAVIAATAMAAFRSLKKAHIQIPRKLREEVKYIPSADLVAA
jgi:hypothetical protein